jgi:hypothetical protein
VNQESPSGGFDQRPEVIKHGAAACRIVDNDKPPRLTETNRRSQARQVNEAFNCTGRQRFGAKAPYIATPDQEFAQLDTESVVEPLHPSTLACVNLSSRRIGLNRAVLDRPHNCDFAALFNEAVSVSF